MSFFATPSANLHSPGAIGDVTPGSGTFTTINATVAGSASTLGPSFFNYGGNADTYLRQGTLFIQHGPGGAPTIITISDLPTSSSGLAAGTVYSNSGVLTLA